MQEYKKGDTIIISYKKPNHAYVLRSTGIVFDVSDSEIILVHNFSGLIPVDLTKIQKNKVIESEKVTIEEINTWEDIKT